MTPAEFAALDSALLEAYLEENNFPREATAASALEDVAAGVLVPRDFYDYLTDGNRALFEADIAGAEVYRLPADRAQWVRTHSEALEDVCYTYGYYFGLIEVDPTDADRLYIAGVPLIQSEDGGETWSSIGAPNVHVDHHHLWIDPANPDHLINGNDGGINISGTAAKTGSSATARKSANFTPSKSTTLSLTASMVACRTTALGAAPPPTATPRMAPEWTLFLDLHWGR